MAVRAQFTHNFYLMLQHCCFEPRDVRPLIGQHEFTLDPRVHT